MSLVRERVCVDGGSVVADIYAIDRRAVVVAHTTNTTSTTTTYEAVSDNERKRPPSKHRSALQIAILSPHCLLGARERSPRLLSFVPIPAINGVHSSLGTVIVGLLAF